MPPPEVAGRTVDDATRCVHHDGDDDVVAIKAPCCGTWYPCYECHDDAEDHALQPWARDAFETEAVLCGVCEATHSIHGYLDADDRCPACGADWNPACRKHHPIYFDVDPSSVRGSPAIRVGLLTVGLLVAFVGLGVAVVGLAGAIDVPILGVPPGVPQVLLGAALVLVGIALGQAAWDLAFPPEEE